MLIFNRARARARWIYSGSGAACSIREARGVGTGEGTQPVYKTAERRRLSLAGYKERVAKVKVRTLDADSFLRAVTQRYDVIIADFPDPRAPDLAKLYSLEFYLQVRHRLRPGGILLTQASSPYDTRRAFWCIHDTLRAAGFYVLPLHAHIPTFGAWGFLLARLESLPAPKGRPPVQTRYLTAPVLASASVFPPHISRPPEALAGGGKPSTRLDPRVMRYYLKGEPLAGPILFPGTSTRR